MDGWDPQKEDYLDKNFNSYDRGPGRNIPKNHDKSAGTKLYITGIPKDLSNGGLENLFSRAGSVLGAKVAQSKQPNSKTTFGFVTMENLSQVEDAIRQLNHFRLGEHTLSVRIAMSEEERLEKKKKQTEDEAFLNSLPSSKNSIYRMKGSDSDSDRGSTKSARSRRGMVNGNGPVQSSSPGRQQIGQGNGRPGLLGAYQGNSRSGVKSYDTGVSPNPSLINQTTRSSSMSERFKQMEYGDDDEDFSGSQYGGGSYRGRGMGRGLMRGGYNRYENYGRERPPQDQYGGGYNGPPVGYGRGNPYQQPGYAPANPHFQPGYGPVTPYGDNRNVGYQGYGYGRGQPNPRGDYYGGQQNDYYNNSYHQSYHSTPNFRGRGRQPMRGAQRGGYGRGQGMNDSRATSIESLQVPKKVKVEARPCNVCKKTGSFQCSRCKTPYCSEKCQKDDWEIHKNLCKSLRNNNDFESCFENQFEISVGEDFTEKIKTQVEQTTGDKVALGPKKDGSRNDRNDKPQESQKPRNQQPSPRTSDDSSKPNAQQQLRQSPGQKGGIVSPRPTQGGLTSPRSSQTTSITSKPKQESPKIASVPLAPIKQPPIKYTGLPINTETQVMVLAVNSPDHFAVSLLDVEMMEARAELGVLMNKSYVSSSDKVQTPQKGMVYAAQFSVDKSWYRARVESVQGESIGITFLDYGNTETVSVDNLRILQPDMFNLKAQAITCCLDAIRPSGNTWPSGAIDKLKSVLVPTEENHMIYHVTAVSQHGEVFKVKITDDTGVDPRQILIDEGLALLGDRAVQPVVSSPQTKPTASKADVPVNSSAVVMSSDLGSLSSTLSVGDKLQVLVIAKESPTLFYAQSLGDPTLIEKYCQLSEELETNFKRPSFTPYRPQCVGEIVIAKFKDDGNWYRAEVKSLTSDGAKCDFIDFGNSDFVPYSCIQKPSAMCTTVPKFALKLKLFGLKEPQTWNQKTLDLFSKIIAIEKQQGIEVEVKLLTSDIVAVDFKDESGQSASKLVQESMAPSEVTMSSKQIVMADSVPTELLPVDGTQVEVMTADASLELNKLYVQKATIENVNILETISKELNSYCNAETTPYSPIEGELVCALFPTDKLWYRAEILNANGECYLVQFVDYGNMSSTSSSGIRRISPSLATIPRQAVCCTLSGIDLSSLSQEQIQIFSTSFFDHVIKVQANKLVNGTYSATFFNKLDRKNINDLIKPKHGTESESKSTSGQKDEGTIMASSLSMESLNMDGTKLKAYVTDSDPDMKFIYVQIVSEKSKSTLETLSKQLQEYCHSQSTPYIPIKGELVCALFTDACWYRAEVKEINGDEFTVFFVDYGNKETVKTSAICKISKSLANLPKQSVCCNLIDVNLKSLTEDTLVEFVKKVMNNQTLMVQGLAQKDGYYDVKMYTLQDECVNEIFGSASPSKSKPPTSVPKTETVNSDVVVMANTFPSVSMPLDGAKVGMKLTDFSDLNDLYFQNDNQQALELLSNQVCSFCQSDMVPHTPVKGELVCALFSDDSKWYRAEVLEMNNNDCNVRFVDFGNCDNVNCSNIRKMDQSLTKFPKQAVCCHLKGLDLSTLPKETLLEFLQTAVSETVHIQPLNKSASYYDVLVFSSNGENLNQKYGSQEPAGETVFSVSSTAMSSLPLDGSKVDVFITDASSMDKVYLQYYGEENQKKQTDLLIAVNTYCQNHVGPYCPKKGELVCAVFEETWYRAEVLAVNGDSYKILYVDYGNFAEVKSDLICKINKDLANIPIQAICCCLHGVDLKSLSPENVQLFAELVMGGKMVKVEALELKDRCYDVKLFTNDGTCVNEVFSSPPSAISTELMLAKSLPKITLQVNELPVDAVITEVIDDSTFYVQVDIIKTQSVLSEILGPVQQYCLSNTTPHKPVKGELVCAQFSLDKIWCRAEVQEVIGDKYRVQYIDFGNRETVSESVIRRYDPSLGKHPVQCVLCCLHDIQPSKQVHDYLTLLKEVEMKMKVVKKENDIYHVVIIANDNNINDLLKAETQTVTGRQNELKSMNGTDARSAIRSKDVGKVQPKGDSFDVVITHVVNPSEIFCQLADTEAIESLAAVMQSMMCRCETEQNSKDFDPHVGDLVCAFYHVDDGWYRGCVVESYKNGSYLIHYCDFGNSEVLTKDQIRSMLPEFVQMPLLAIKCSLADLSPTGPNWDTAAIEKVNQFREKRLKAHVIRREGDCYVLDLVDEDDPRKKISICDLLVTDGNARRASKGATGVDDATLIQQQIAALQAQLAAMGK